MTTTKFTVTKFTVVKASWCGFPREYRLRRGTTLRIVPDGPPVDKSTGRIRRDVYRKYFEPVRPKTKKASKTETKE